MVVWVLFVLFSFSGGFHLFGGLFPYSRLPTFLLASDFLMNSLTGSMTLENFLSFSVFPSPRTRDPSFFFLFFGNPGFMFSLQAWLIMMGVCGNFHILKRKVIIKNRGREKGYFFFPLVFIIYFLYGNFKEGESLLNHLWPESSINACWPKCVSTLILHKPKDSLKIVLSKV